MPISIYPPTLQSTQPAFLSSVNVYQINFTLQPITSFNDIGHVQVRLVRQSNNKSIVNTDQYPDGTIYKAPSAIGSLGNQYFVSINRSELAESWQPGYLYKVQMRFGINPMYTSLSEFATWKQQQIDAGAFSEWSTVMIIKAIDTPIIKIENDEAKREDVISTERIEATLTPLFIGSFNISSASNELLDRYKFDLYEGASKDPNYLLETSGWLQHNGSINNTDTYRFKTVLTNNKSYTVVYSIITINEYEGESEPYNFSVNRTYLGDLERVSIRVEDNDVYCRENGCIKIFCTAKNGLSGSYVITRSSEKSNYQIWEDLKYLKFSNQVLNDSVIHVDFAIESGIRYKYAIQQENSAGLRTSQVYDTSNQGRSVDFQYSYIYRDNIQLKLSLNQTLSSFKHTTLRSKQDTLGSKYPHLVQNGKAYYAEFPISGLISFQMDEDQTFFSLKDDGLYYNNELVIPKDKFIKNNVTRGKCQEKQETYSEVSTDENKLSISTSLTNDNIFIERIFREKVEEFLNDFNYKLFKSSTEGNIIIGLLNVSLTPNNMVGRMIYSFSATAYEVLENTIENLNEVNIINIGKFESLASEDRINSFGQLSGIYGRNIDLYAKIREQEEVSIGGGYKLNLIQVTDIQIEQYPKIDLTARLLELEALKSEAAGDDEDTSEYDRQIQECKDLILALDGPESATIEINVNGSRILVAPNRVYHLNENVNSLSLSASSVPIIVNYVCQLNQVEDVSVGVVSAIDASRIWGQISGIFTGTDGVLKFYNYDYRNSETYRIFSNVPPNMEKFLVKDKQGDTIVDNTTFNLYKTINIYEIIKEETQKQVELIYNTHFELNDDGQLTDGEIYYTFSDIVLLDIEADEGTTLLISSSPDGSDTSIIKIGSTGRYTLNPLDNMVKYIALESAQFCVINYKCLTNQMRMKVEQYYV